MATKRTWPTKPSDSLPQTRGRGYTQVCFAPSPLAVAVAVALALAFAVAFAVALALALALAFAFGYLFDSACFCFLLAFCLRSRLLPACFLACCLLAYFHR